MTNRVASGRVYKRVPTTSIHRPAVLEYARMPLRCAVVLPIVLALLWAGSAAAQDGDRTDSLTLRSYLIYDVTGDSIAAVMNRDQRQPIASLTKLMTAILTCERLRFDGRYILSEAEAKTFGVETMRASKMLELMLVPSNNEICRVAARRVSGSEQAFTAEMNAKARQLGLSDTRFANATGLPAADQYSTMDDVLLLARVALTYPRIRQAIRLSEVELAGKRYDGTLMPLYDRHPGLLGGKTGYTRAAGRCLVLLYTARGRDYIVITFGSKDVDAGFRDAELVLSRHGLYDGEVGEWE